MQIYLYQLRKEKGITQKELAQKLGISETAYRQKEKGQSAFKWLIVNCSGLNKN